MNVCESGKAGPSAIKAWHANTATAKGGSYAHIFNSGADPIIEKGKMLIANGVYQALPREKRTYG